MREKNQRTDYYEKNFRQYHELSFSIDPSSFLSPLAKALGPGSRILDVGCGSGRDMKWLKARGFRPMGLERSRGLAALAREHSGCPVLEEDFEVHDFSGMEKMDAVLLVGALVHVPHENLEAVFSRILEALKPEGKVLLTMKEGVQDASISKDRIFYQWLDEYLRKIFRQLNLKALDFSRQVSKIRKTDVWLGYVLKLRN